MSTTPVSRVLSVALCGAGGRMGVAVAACAARDPDNFRVVAQIGRNDSVAAAIKSADAVIDFSALSALEDLISDCEAERKPLVIGTTGFDESVRRRITQAAQNIPIVLAANFSVGVNALFWLTREAARILGTRFDLEVIEMHHRLKKDAPSGTARRLAEILAQERSLHYDEHAKHGRTGVIGPRGSDEIGLHAVRGGDVVGEHTVIFADNGERLELTHRATSRETFALGALRAAAWLRAQPPGLYDMEDVLGLRSLTPLPSTPP